MKQKKRQYKCSYYSRSVNDQIEGHIHTYVYYIILHESIRILLPAVTTATPSVPVSLAVASAANTAVVCQSVKLVLYSRTPPKFDSNGF
jgi:hypothetical protein